MKLHLKQIRCTTAIPLRGFVGVMVFTACLFSYMLRVNMSINLIAMVEPRINTNSGEVNTPECRVITNNTLNTEPHSIPDYGVKYNWDQQTQGLILGAYFWGYILTSIPGGLMAERWGPLQVVGWTGLLSGTLTILTPVAASLHYSLVIVIRFVMGLLGGTVYPALHCLIARWSPPIEKGKFASALLGGSFGTVITWPILGAVSENWGWVWAFYIPGSLCLIWVAFWYLIVADTPAQHSTITDDERKYIQKCIGDSVTQKKQIPPYLKIFTSLPFWSLVVLHFGNLWGLYFLLTAGPKFMAEVLGFNLSHSGGLASLPYLARMLFGFFFGSIGDLIRRKKWLTVTGIRKWFVLCSHILPGILLFVQSVTGCNIVLAIVIITLSLGLNGACTITNIQNSQDLAPNFAGTLYGIINCIGGTTGFITPILTAYITRDHSGMAEWQTIFLIGGSVYVASGLIFCVFGSGDMQPWNNTCDRSDEPPAKEETKQAHDNEAFQHTEDEQNIPNENSDNKQITKV